MTDGGAARSAPDPTTDRLLAAGPTAGARDPDAAGLDTSDPGLFPPPLPGDLIALGPTLTEAELFAAHGLNASTEYFEGSAPLSTDLSTPPERDRLDLSTDELDDDA